MPLILDLKTILSKSNTPATVLYIILVYVGRRTSYDSSAFRNFKIVYEFMNFEFRNIGFRLEPP